MVTAAPSLAADPTCEDELTVALSDLDAHDPALVDQEAVFMGTCEQQLDQVYVELDRVHSLTDGVTDDPPQEGAVCVNWCSCGACLQWDDPVSDDLFSRRMLMRG
ncbi:MAG: hypothetical protein H6736_22265 [Alphaproteobacteria bacterium]|nr:hypothetical protein [Alphaproteobacteria bacterium]